MKTAFLLAYVCCVCVELCWAWSGHYETVRHIRSVYVSYCACWYWWWGCSYWRGYWRTEYYDFYQCQAGWTHNGNQICDIPICLPTCRNGGKCVNPNDCDCPSYSSGRYTGCSSLNCSYKWPCYPGDCMEEATCKCEPGFILTNRDEGCTTLNSSHTELQPFVGKSNVTLSNIRRTDQRVDYMFILEGTNTSSNNLEVIWSNQKRFNNLRFEYETYFQQPENLPERPAYVSNAELGIINSFIEVNVSKVARNGGRIRDDGSFKSYPCEGGFTRDKPAKEIAKCEVNDDQFRTLIEHGDWLNVRFKSDSGGYQQLINLDNKGNPYARRYYKSLRDVKEVQFNFDFIAPKHCSESGSWGTCPPGAVILKVDNEFTKDAITARWSGWTDDLSGVLEYYVEIFLLRPDPYGRLVEKDPIKPLFTATPPHSNITYPKYRPAEPGMYSVLMETRDTANNSRISRRFVLYDNRSEISISKDHMLFISSAVSETGYMWQTPTNGKSVTLEVVWANHFLNAIHEDNKLLNDILPYPIQFKDIQDDGVLFSEKYVSDALDDNEGRRTRKAITNYHGMVKFEIGKEFTLSEEEPNYWELVSPFEERTSFQAKLDDGNRVRVWIRATDMMNNTKTDSTLIRVDGTPPTITKTGDQDHEVKLNVENATFNYTSRLLFASSDLQSGVHKIEYTIIIRTAGNGERAVYTGVSPAKKGETLNNPHCIAIEGTCFIASQQIDLDNCWFMTKKSELDTSTAVVNLTVYNQALLTTSTQFQIGLINRLKGLEKYDGPENVRIESSNPNGFRIAWDLPEKTSCFGRAEIVLVLLRKGPHGEAKLETYYTSGSSKYFDILGLDPETDYQIKFALRTSNATVPEEGVSLAVKTEAAQVAGSSSGAYIALGVVLAAVALATVLFAVLIRRGVIQPAKHVRHVSRRVRETVYGRFEGSHQRIPKGNLYGYDNRQSELYIYGTMDMGSSQMWNIDRKDVTLETLIKTGHFAKIYRAHVKGRKGGDIVVAKTLKEHFTKEDELTMKAKINFTGSTVGEHPNILAFIGAVVNDTEMGPFIIYEYCEHGTLKDYLGDSKTNITIELTENLFRFGLDIAKGMEYLAGKEIVHRRLAARNVLLTFLNEVKISGFGPQPNEEEGEDSEDGRRERIPIKWMAPECMESTKHANEKSDVWSYGVVLWEIFSIGETPYTCKSRDLLSYLKKGQRLPKPEQCDDTWYSVMQKCWAYEPKKRPTFADIRGELGNMFTEAPGDSYYYYKR